MLAFFYFTAVKKESPGNDRMVQWWKDNDFRPVPLAATDIMSGLQTGMIEAVPSTSWLPARFIHEPEDKE